MFFIKILSSCIKTFCFNFRYLSLRQAIHFPVRIYQGFHIMKMKGKIILDFDWKNEHIVLGHGGSPALQSFSGGMYLDAESSITFRGNAVISEGTVLRCDKGANITIGKNLYFNKNNYIRSSCSVVFGDGCTLGWNNTINTTDGHYFASNDTNSSLIESPIYIGNHVWITTHCILNKGAVIPNGCVVAQGSIITKRAFEENSLIGGIPAKVIKQHIVWKN